jgi:uncharacterized protein YndB with AHSA1/START domain
VSEIKFNKFYPLEKERMSKYFSEKALVEKWQAPSGMTLRLPKYEARAGGNYRYEHTSKDGVYVCEGSFKEFKPGERIVQFDKFIRGPKGDNLFENLETSVDFVAKTGGTELRIRQAGFKNEEQANMCQEGWEQSLDLLSELVNKEVGMRSGKPAPGSERELRT